MFRYPYCTLSGRWSLGMALAVAAVLLTTETSAWGQGIPSGNDPDLQSPLAKGFAQPDPALVPRLIKDLQNPDESVRLRAAKELGKLGVAAREAIPALQNALKDADEDVRRVANSSLKAIQAAEPPQIRAEARVDFDALNASKGAVTGAPLTEYLAQFGITLSGLTPGTRVEVLDTRAIYDGKAARATSSPNVITQGGSTKAVAWTMNFRAALEKVTFTRVALIADPSSGITHPGWSVIALDGNGKEVDCVTEKLISSFVDVPAATFTLRGPGIAAIRVESNARDFTAFGAVLIDDLVLYGGQGGSQVQDLIRDLQNPDESVRLRAAKELGKLGPAARDAVPMLQKLAQDPDEDVRRVAAAALTRILAVTTTDGPRPDLFMLSVGIDRYAPPINSLLGCVNDAEGMASVFRRQAGKGYGKVEAQVLTDAEGTRAKVDAGLSALRTKGKAGDWYVILLSGHGGPRLNRWGFLTHDGGDVTDAALLGLADQLANEGKKVVIIIDACFAGQLRYAAHPILNKYTDPRKGGIILMLSSMPAQTSAALQRYSAFARAAEEGLAGMADYDSDQMITLKELRRFTYNRVYELCLERRSLPGLTVQSQDSAIDASLSMPESTPLTQGQKTTAPRRDDGPFTALPQLTGVWVSGAYRLQVNGNGTFRASVSQQNRTVQSGDGLFRANAKTIVLQHWQGDDRLDIVSLTSNEFRFRFHGREVALKKETVAPPTAGSVAGTTWTGTEDLPGYGKLTFQFVQGGEALMVDAKKTIKGTWSQSANKVTITFQNCVYEGTVQGKSMTGNAHFTTDDRTWTFALTFAGATPPSQQPPDTPVTTVAGTVWSGTESLSGFGTLTFEFHGDAKAVMIDAQATVNGNWSQAGNQVTITFQNCVYVGRIQGNVLSGNARYTEGDPRDWTFSVTRRP